jgi:hypothetical protein
MNENEETYCSEEMTVCDDWAMYGECIHQTPDYEPKFFRPYKVEIDPVTEFVIQQIARQAGIEL